MTGKRTLALLIACLAVVAAQPAFGAYASIQHNLINGVDDTNYNPGTGELTIDAFGAGGGGLSLNDPTNLAGARSNIVMHLSTFFHTIQGDGDIVFNGGSYSLTFDLGGNSYEISGPIYAIELSANISGPNLVLNGSGLFTADTVNLPGSGVWPAVGYSTLDTLTLAFNTGGQMWDPSGPIPGVRQETIYSLFPNDSGIPEPASLGLLALGGLLVARRRR